MRPGGMGMLAFGGSVDFDAGGLVTYRPASISVLIESF